MEKYEISDNNTTNLNVNMYIYRVKLIAVEQYLQSHNYLLRGVDVRVLGPVCVRSHAVMFYGSSSSFLSLYTAIFLCTPKLMSSFEWQKCKW